MTFKHALIFLITCSIIPAIAFSQDIVDRRHLEIEQGLASRNVNKIIRDHTGYFYVFTDHEVQRWDGSNFANVDFPKTKEKISFSDSLSNYTILKNGTIAIVPSNSSRAIFGIATGKLILEKVWEKDQSNYGYFLGFQTIYRIDKMNGIIQIFNGKSFEATEIQFQESIPHKLFKSNSRIFIQDKFKNIFEKFNNKWHKIIHHGDLIFNKKYELFLINSNYIFKLINNKFEKIIPFANDQLIYKWSKIDSQGNLIIAFMDKSRKQLVEKIMIYSIEGKLLNLPNILDNKKIQDIQSINIFRKLMMATHNGLYAYSFRPNSFEVNVSAPGVGRSEFGVIVMGVSSTKKGDLIILQEAGLLRKDILTGKILKPNKNKLKSDYSEGTFQRLKKTKTDNFWTFSFKNNFTSSIHNFDPSFNRIETYSIPFIVREFYCLENNLIILGGQDDKQNGILASFNPQNQKLVYHNIFNDLESSVILAIEYNKTYDWIIIGTKKGMFILNRNFEVLHHVSNLSSTQGARSHIRIIKNYTNDQILIGLNQSGLTLFDLATLKVIKSINESNGLSNNTVVSIEEDCEQHLWIGTYNGLNVLNSKFEQILTINDYDGLPNREFNTQASHLDSNCKLHFGTVNGLVSFDPNEILKLKPTASIDIKEIYAYNSGKERTIEHHNNNDINIFWQDDSIKLVLNKIDYFNNYNQSLPRNFLHFKDSHAINHDIRYKEIVLRDIPKGSNSIEFKTFNNLATRKYVIHNNFNLKKATFWFLLFTSTTLVIWSIIQARSTHQQKEKQKELELSKRIANLELSALQAQMNPHFIFNALGSVEYYILKNEIEKAEVFLSDFAQLMRMILESSKTRFISIEEEIQMLSLYIGLEKLRFSNKFDFSIDVDDAIDQSQDIPPMIIQPIIENAINHGLYHLKSRKGNLQIKFELTPDESKIIISIKDNGIGRLAAQKFRRINHKSRGTEILNERISTLNQSGLYGIKLKYTDLVKNKEPIGTAVKITLELNDN